MSFCVLDSFIYDRVVVSLTAGEDVQVSILIYNENETPFDLTGISFIGSITTPELIPTGISFICAISSTIINLLTLTLLASDSNLLTRSRYLCSLKMTIPGNKVNYPRELKLILSVDHVSAPVVVP